jgi:hypothetical protein
LRKRKNREGKGWEIGIKLFLSAVLSLKKKKEEQKIEKTRGRMGKENSKTRWKMQKERDCWNGSKKMDGKG